MKKTTIFSFAAVYPSVSLNNGTLIDLNVATGLQPSIQFGSGANFDLIGVSVYVNNSAGDAIEFKSATLEPIQTNGSQIFTAIGTDFVNTASTTTFIQVTSAINKLPQPIAIPAGVQVQQLQVLPYRTQTTDLRVQFLIYCEYDI